MKAVIISFFITLSTLTSHAQQRDIVLTGTVTDHQNEPLPGATIRTQLMRAFRERAGFKATG
jgi:hypothetical protein